MEIHASEWVGYAASITVAISLIMSSIIKFRWFNLSGAVLFTIYGFWISAWPVFFFNSCIIVINFYYLYKIYTRKEEFEIVETAKDGIFLYKFTQFHKKEIQKISPDFDFNLSNKEYSYFITRNMALVGLFLAHKESDGVLKVDLDFVTPQYRDFKNGSFLYQFLTNTFQKSGIKTLNAIGKTSAHQRYLKEMGFKNNGTDIFVKQV